MQSEFVITLPHQYNESEYLNTILDFSVVPYEVCLQEIIFPSHAWQNFTEECAEITLGLFNADYSKSETWKGKMPVRNYASNDDLVEAISHVVDIISRQIRDVAAAGIPAAGPADGIFRVPDKANTFKLRLKRPGQYVMFNPMLSYILGITDNYDCNTTPPAITNDFLFDDSIDLTRYTIEKIWVHADFVIPQIVGNTYIPLLALVPLDVSNASVSYKMNPLYYYVPVARKKISILNTFLCSTLDGVKLSILKPYIVTLHFRRRNTSLQHILDGFPVIVTLKGSDNLTVQLNSRMDFAGRQYKVNLHDVWVSDEGWPQVRSGASTIEVIHGRDVARFTMLDSYYNNAYEIFQAMNMYVQLVDGSTEIKTFKHEGKYYAVIKGNVTIILPKELNYLYGITPTLTNERIELKEGYIFDYSKVDMKRFTLERICVFADFVKETQVGKECHQLLRIVPMRAHVLEYSMLVEEYVEVQPRMINSMSFRIKDSLHNPIPMYFTCTLTLAMHFREQ